MPILLALALLAAGFLLGRLAYLIRSGKVTLVDDAGKWWKKQNTWLAAAYAAAGAAVMANPAILFGFIDRLPDPWRTIATAFAGILLAALPVVSAQVKAKKP